MGRVLSPNMQVVHGSAVYYNENENKTVSPDGKCLFEYVRGSYISLLSPFLNDLMDRNGLALWFLTCWETYFFREL